jgi:hypothetical protein
MGGGIAANTADQETNIAHSATRCVRVRALERELLVALSMARAANGARLLLPNFESASARIPTFKIMLSCIMSGATMRNAFEASDQCAFGIIEGAQERCHPERPLATVRMPCAPTVRVCVTA